MESHVDYLRHSCTDKVGKCCILRCERGENTHFCHIGRYPIHSRFIYAYECFPKPIPSALKKNIFTVYMFAIRIQSEWVNLALHTFKTHEDYIWPICAPICTHWWIRCCSVCISSILSQRTKFISTNSMHFSCIFPPHYISGDHISLWPPTETNTKQNPPTSLFCLRLRLNASACFNWQ